MQQDRYGHYTAGAQEDMAPEELLDSPGAPGSPLQVPINPALPWFEDVPTLHQRPRQHQAPSASLQHAQYWCYVSSARNDMAPEEFQVFLEALGPPPAPGPAHPHPGCRHPLPAQHP